MRCDALIICATPRSGTTLLCDLLAGSGTTGQPGSFYRRESVPDFAAAWGVAAGADFDRRYLIAAIAAGRGASDLFSMRVMWPSLPEVTRMLAPLFPNEVSEAGRIAAAFGPPLYVFVSREDKLAQAVSRVKAEQSGLWHRAADGSDRERVRSRQQPAYDRMQIQRSMDETLAHERAWRSWFAAQAIAPLAVTYEALSADPVGTLATVLAAAGRDTSLAARAEVRTARLADAQSEDWARRFRAGQ